MTKTDDKSKPFGFQALDIFFKRHNLAVSEKYPSLWYDKPDANADFNPNINYLYNLDDDIKPTQTSPFFCFTLMKEQKGDDTNAMQTSLYLLHFLNWAVYYYKRLHSTYNSIPKDPDKSLRDSARENVNCIAEIMTNLTGMEYSEEFRMEQTEATFKKNNFSIKPAYFLKLCRFFARAWFEEHFCTPDDTRGSVEFAYYISMYIKASLLDKAVAIKRYDGNGEYYKKEVKRLLKKLPYIETDAKELRKADIDITHDNFRIQLYRFNDCRADGYAIAISQHATHHFQLFARLFLQRLEPSPF